MKSNSPSLDSELAEVRYKIRALLQHLGWQGEMTTELCDNIELYIEDDEPKASRWNSCICMMDTIVSLTKDTNTQLAELRALLAEYSELMRKNG